MIDDEPNQGLRRICADLLGIYIRLFAKRQLGCLYLSKYVVASISVTFPKSL
jgi:hypothetical protein